MEVRFQERIFCVDFVWFLSVWFCLSGLFVRIFVRTFIVLCIFVGLDGRICMGVSPHRLFFLSARDPLFVLLIERCVTLCLWSLIRGVCSPLIVVLNQRR